jgi:death-on-curing family protein
MEDVYRAASAVMAINEPVFGRPRYRSLNEKLAALVYELCKQHFFLNGNKRIAYFFLIYVLVLNERMIEVSTFEEKALVMEWVADSDPRDRKRILRELTELIRTHSLALRDRPVTGASSN